MTRALVVALAALALVPNAIAGGLRVHVTGGGTITLYPSGSQPCRSDTPMLVGGCMYDDLGGGLILAETPDPGWTFAGWPYPGCSPFPGGYCQTGGTQGPSCCNDITVVFNRVSVALGVYVTGSGKGSVLSSPVGIDCSASCSASYDWGTTVTLTPQPAIGSVFVGWSGACSGSGACTVTVQAAASVGAAFDVMSVSVSVVKTGTGSGVVTSASRAISCGPTCSAPFTYGSTVLLSAAAATGSFFVSWAGACTGRAECDLAVGGAPVGVAARFDAVVVTLRPHTHALALRLYVPRTSTLAISLRGAGRYSVTLPLRPGRNTPTLALPSGLKRGRYVAHFLLRDANGAAALSPASFTL